METANVVSRRGKEDAWKAKDHTSLLLIYPSSPLALFVDCGEELVSLAKWSGKVLVDCE